MTEHSEEMIAAGYDALMKCKPLQTTDCEKEAVEAIYTAMHEARPTTDVSTDGLVAETQRIIESLMDLEDKPYFTNGRGPSPVHEIRALIEALQRSNAAKDETQLHAAFMAGWLTRQSSPVQPTEAWGVYWKALSHSSETSND